MSAIPFATLCLAQQPVVEPVPAATATPFVHIQRVWCERPANPSPGPRAEICATIVVHGMQGQTLNATACLLTREQKPVRLKQTTPPGWTDERGGYRVVFTDQVRFDQAIWQPRRFFVPDEYLEPAALTQPLIVAVTATCGGLTSTAQAEVSLRPPGIRPVLSRE